MKIGLPSLSLLLIGVLLGACSPKYNWRDYASPDAPYRVMFPGKPASVTRTIDLDGTPASMTMTAADVDGATIAVGAAEAADEAQARAAVPAMMKAMMRNIGADDTRNKVHADAAGRTVGEIDTAGKVNGAPVHLVGRFEARGKRFYQVIVLGKPNAMPPEQVEQFLTSFTLP
ncbi:MAG: hypothetical protein WCC39_19800 [Telluria sp.]